MVKRKHTKNLWVDETFWRWLNQMKARKILDGEKVDNLGDITKMMMTIPALTEVERQLLKNKTNNVNIRIKMDTRRLFQ